MARKLVIFLIVASSVRLLYSQAKPINSSADLYEAEYRILQEPIEDLEASKKDSSVRTQRQVFPLKWLDRDEDDDDESENDDDDELSAAEQRSQVADQIMREADAIRAIIQDTIDATIHAADPNQVSSPRKTSRKQSRKSSKSSASSSNQADAIISNLLALFPTTAPEPAATDTAFMESFRTLWSDFLENSKQMWTAMPPAENAEESDLLQQFQRLWLQFLGTARKMLD